MCGYPRRQPSLLLNYALNHVVCTNEFDFSLERLLLASLPNAGLQQYSLTFKSRTRNTTYNIK